MSSYAFCLQRAPKAISDLGCGTRYGHSFRSRTAAFRLTWVNRERGIGSNRFRAEVARLVYKSKLVRDDGATEDLYHSYKDTRWALRSLQS